MTSLISKIDRFKGTRIMIIGDLMVDRYIRGKVSRISPEAPVPVVETEEEDYMPGGAGNVAYNISELGGRPLLMAVVGRDPEGDHLLSSLRDRNIDVHGVIRDDTRPTILKTRVIAGHQQVVRFDRESRSPLSSDIIRCLLENVKQKISSVKGIIVSDYGKGVVTAGLLKALLPYARRYKKFVIVDPKVEHFLRYRGVQCMTPNLKEATEGIHSLPPKSDQEVDAIGQKILKKLKCHSVLVTRGERGMSLYQTNGKTVHIPSHAQEVYDVTGAGDTVISTLSLALAVGSSYPEAATLSNVAASVVVGKLGTATIHVPELKAALKKVQSNK